MTSRIPSPLAQWVEPATSGAALPLALLYWHYDAGLDEWSLVSSAALESGRFADLTGTGVYELALFASIGPTTPVLRSTLRGADTFVY